MSTALDHDRGRRSGIHITIRRGHMRHEARPCRRRHRHIGLDAYDLEEARPCSRRRCLVSPAAGDEAALGARDGACAEL